MERQGLYKKALEDKAELEWNKQMLELMRKMLHCRNSLSENESLSPSTQKQSVTLRSLKNLCYICDGLSIVYLLRSNEENVYQKIAEIYGRQRPPKSEGKTDAAV